MNEERSLFRVPARPLQSTITLKIKIPKNHAKTFTAIERIYFDAIMCGKPKNHDQRLSSIPKEITVGIQFDEAGTPYQQAFEQKMELARRGIKKYHNALHELAR